jgi:AcrR family transcriptional regulator
VSEIAREAGLTQAAAYAYFSSKEELFFAAVDSDAAALVAETMATVGDLPASELVPGLVLSTIDLLDQHPLARRVLAGDEPEAVGRLVEIPALEGLARFLAERLATGQTTGDVRTDINPRSVGAGIEALLLGLLFTVVQSGGLATTRHQHGVTAAFRAMIAPH